MRYLRSDALQSAQQRYWERLRSTYEVLPSEFRVFTCKALPGRPPFWGGWERLRYTYEVLPPSLSTGSRLSGLAVQDQGWVGTRCNVQSPYEVLPEARKYRFEGGKECATQAAVLLGAPAPHLRGAADL